MSLNVIANKIVIILIFIILLLVLPIMSVNKSQLEDDTSSISDSNCLDKTTSLENIFENIRGPERMNLVQYLVRDSNPISYIGCEENMLYVYTRSGGSHKKYVFKKDMNGYMLISKRRYME